MKSNYEDPLEEATHREETRCGLELVLTVTAMGGGE